jgi:hypothetical protein
MRPQAPCLFRTTNYKIVGLLAIKQALGRIGSTDYICDIKTTGYITRVLLETYKMSYRHDPWFHNFKTTGYITGPLAK